MKMILKIVIIAIIIMIYQIQIIETQFKLKEEFVIGTRMKMADNLDLIIPTISKIMLKMNSIKLDHH